MKDCCGAKESDLAALRDTQSRTLKIVLGINAAMFLLEVVFGILSHSTSLLADSLDMLGDAIVYGFSLYVLHRGTRERAKAAMLKGGIMVVFGVGVLVQAIYRAVSGTVPDSQIMGAVGLLALAANGICLALLFRHRTDDLNMRSTWICSRNDIVANVSVLVAAGLVSYLHSNVPDLAVGALIAIVSLSSATAIIRESFEQLKTAQSGAGMSPPA
jgi:cation diffusion facilitator family transporter